MEGKEFGEHIQTGDYSGLYSQCIKGFSCYHGDSPDIAFDQPGTGGSGDCSGNRKKKVAKNHSKWLYRIYERNSYSCFNIFHLFGTSPAGAGGWN